MRCIIHEVRRNSISIATNFKENTAHFSQLEIIILIQSIPRDALNKYGKNQTFPDEHVKLKTRRINETRSEMA